MMTDHPWFETTVSKAANGKRTQPHCHDVKQNVPERPAHLGKALMSALTKTRQQRGECNTDDTCECPWPHIELPWRGADKRPPQLSYHALSLDMTQPHYLFTSMNCTAVELKAKPA